MKNKVLRILVVGFLFAFSFTKSNATICLPNSSSHPASICDGDSIFLQHAFRYTAATYYDTLMNVGGCDSVVSTVLSVNPTYSINTSAAICQGQSMFLQGAWRTSAGVYTDHYTTVAFGCDSAIHTTLIIHPVYAININASVCSGDSIFLSGAFQHNAGVFVDNPGTAVYGCDSIITTTLTINPVYHLADSVSICNKDSMLIGGVYRKTAGIYSDTLHSIHGCDSITARTLIIKPIPGAFPAVFDPAANTLLIINIGDTLAVKYNIFAHYQWYKDNALLVGDSARKYLPVTGGVYKARVMNTYHCYSFSSNSLSSAVGISKVAPIGGWELFPNPSNGAVSVNIESTVTEQGVLTMTDILGQKLSEQKVMIVPGANSLHVDFAAQSDGLYFISFSCPSGMKTARVVIRK